MTEFLFNHNKKSKRTSIFYGGKMFVLDDPDEAWLDKAMQVMSSDEDMIDAFIRNVKMVRTVLPDYLTVLDGEIVMKGGSMPIPENLLKVLVDETHVSPAGQTNRRLLKAWVTTLFAKNPEIAKDVFDFLIKEQIPLSSTGGVRAFAVVDVHPDYIKTNLPENQNRLKLVRQFGEKTEDFVAYQTPSGIAVVHKDKIAPESWSKIDSLTNHLDGVEVVEKSWVYGEVNLPPEAIVEDYVPMYLNQDDAVDEIKELKDANKQILTCFVLLNDVVAFFPDTRMITASVFETTKDLDLIQRLASMSGNGIELFRDRSNRVYSKGLNGDENDIAREVRFLLYDD